MEEAPIMYSIKAAILDSLHGKSPPNNESADCKNLACFKGKSEKYASVSTFAHDYWDFLGKIMVIKFLLVSELL